MKLIDEKTYDKVLHMLTEDPSRMPLLQKLMGLDLIEESDVLVSECYHLLGIIFRRYYASTLDLFEHSMKHGDDESIGHNEIENRISQLLEKLEKNISARDKVSVLSKEDVDIIVLELGNRIASINHTLENYAVTNVDAAKVRVDRMHDIINRLK